MTNRKLIEVALPLEAINRESAREKSIRHGHPSTLHLWWARRPLAACRAVLFAQLVDDPSSHPDRFPTEEAQDAERQRLHDIIERLVPWEATIDQRVLEEARAEIRASCAGNPPAVLDPFCGGGSIPLEAQRLGIEVHASDLNPVAVLITKALVEIPPRWSGRQPVHPDGGRLGAQSWVGAQGLAEDVRHYGRWVHDEAWQRIGHLYPDATLPDGSKASMIAWIWARRVECPNPACRVRTPLVRSFWLGKKPGKEAWIKPVPENGEVHFEIGHGPSGPAVGGTVQRTGALCISCGSPISFEHIRAEGMAGRIDRQLIAMVAEGVRQRVYLRADETHERAAAVERPVDAPEGALPEEGLGFRIQPYGLKCFADLFSSRQLVALMAFADLVALARDRVRLDAERAGLSEDDAAEYSDAVVTYLGCAVGKTADYGSTLCTWASHPKQEAVAHTFVRQALAMVWDFAEANPFANAAGSWVEAVQWVAKVIERLPAAGVAHVSQHDARTANVCGFVATDPPYYDNVGYADLADFFYIWLRRALRPVHPEIFATLLTPKSGELVADPGRFDGSRSTAKEYFEEGFSSTLSQLRTGHVADVPLMCFYAFKQASEDAESGTASTGWETLLVGLISAGWTITATWPMRTELGNRMRSLDSNALASSIVLACRPRLADAGVTDRRSFIGSLREELLPAIKHLQQGSIAPVDLAQAALGPGMSVFSRYARVIEPSGEPMRVRAALGLINQVLAEILDEQEGDFDPDTRWAMKWFEQYGMDEGSSGIAEQLCTTYNVSLRGLIESGIVHAVRGKTILVSREDLPSDWDPVTDSRISIWEATQHICKRLDEQGEKGAAVLLARLGGVGDAVRELAYLLFALCEKRGFTKEALVYNQLAASWSELARLAAEEPGPTQERLV